MPPLGTEVMGGCNLSFLLLVHKKSWQRFLIDDLNAALSAILVSLSQSLQMLGFSVTRSLAVRGVVKLDLYNSNLLSWSLTAHS